jgi:hypothetical protein
MSMTSGQVIWFVICIVCAMLWLTCGFIIFPFNFFGVLITMLFAIPCFIRRH